MVIKRIFWHFLNKPLIPLIWALIFFILGSLLISAITVYSSANLMLTEMRDEVPYTVTIQKNPTNSDENLSKSTPHETGVDDGGHQQSEQLDAEDNAGFPIELAVVLESISVVEKASYEISRYVSGIDLQPVVNENETSDRTMSEETVFQLVFVSESSINEDFAMGEKKLVSGEHISENTAENMVMIDEELAELNGLEMGDTIFIPVQGGSGSEAFVIGGIFDSGSSEGAGLSNHEYELFPENQIYIPISNFEKIYPGEAGNVYLDKAVYEVEDATDFDTFSNDAIHMGLSTTAYNIYPNESEFSEKSAELEKTIDQSMKLIIFIGILIFITVYAMAKLTMKNRYQECETLIWLGVSGGKVYVQMMLELMIIALIGFGIAICISDEMIPVLQRLVHDIFLQPPTNIAAIESEDVVFTINSQKPAIIDFFDSYPLVYSMSIKVWSLVIGILITLHAMIIPFWKIWKMDRNKILQNRKEF